MQIIVEEVFQGQEFHTADELKSKQPSTKKRVFHPKASKMANDGSIEKFTTVIISEKTYLCPRLTEQLVQ